LNSRVSPLVAGGSRTNSRTKENPESGLGFCCLGFFRPFGLLLWSLSNPTLLHGLSRLLVTPLVQFVEQFLAVAQGQCHRELDFFSGGIFATCLLGGVCEQRCGCE